MQILSDSSQRLAALDPLHSFIVQAPAGSGKTELLIQRFLVLLARSKNPEEIIAITFTRKAAAEMRTRILEALELATQTIPPSSAHRCQTWELAKAVLESDEKLKWSLRENPNRLRIQTIDSLCASLTRQMPILSHFGAQPEIIDNAYKFYSLAAREVLDTLENDMPWSNQLAELLLHLDNDQLKVEKLLSDMLARRDQWLSHISGIKNHNEQRKVLEKGFHRAIIETQLKLKNSFPTHLISEIISLSHYAASELNDSNSLITHCGELTELPRIDLNDQNKWLGIAELLLTKENAWRKSANKNIGFPAGSSMKQRFLSLLSELDKHEELRQHLTDLRFLPPLFYTENQWKILGILLELLPVLTAQLHVIFQERGAVDYIEITQSALRALGDIESPTDLALALDHKIQHILLDEFQDTSNTQLRLLEQLTMGWQAEDGRTLFLVGDPMQSIYRFRKAEVGLFLHVREHGIGHLRLKPLTLSVNFRSSENIVKWFNEVFTLLMPQKEDISTGAITFSPSLAHATSSPDSGIYFKTLIDAAQNQEALTITQLISELRANNPESSIAILVRARTHLLEILPQLENANIPYRAVEIESLNQRVVIQDLFALTRALLHPADRIAWLAILRAPWCGITLSDLHALVGNNFSETILERLKSIDNLLLSDEGKSRLKNISEILNCALQHRDREPIARWIEGVWYALGGPACVASLSDLNDAQAFFNLLHQLSCENSALDLVQLENELTLLYASPHTQNNHAVEVMTLHKAKGLEFDHVILPGLNRSPPSDEAKLLLHMERTTLTGKMDLLLAPIKSSKDESDPIYDYLRYEEKKRAEYEVTRLLYVAVTRAKKTLHLIANLSRDEKDKTKIKNPAQNSLLAFFWPALEKEFLNNIYSSCNTTFLKNSFQKNKNHLKRLTIDCKLSDTTSGILPKFNFIQQESINKSLSSFSLPNNTLRFIGTITHRLLAQICLEGPHKWNTKFISDKKPFIKNQLAFLGVTTNEIESATEKVERALDNCLKDSRGIWILDNQHRDSRIEYPLSAVVDNKIVSIIIDRTFIDEHGTRWIIDYKTVDYTGSDINHFLENEILHHTQQLEQYAKVLYKKESLPIKLGLYFPLLKTWREWEFDKKMV